MRTINVRSGYPSQLHQLLCGIGRFSPAKLLTVTQRSTKVEILKHLDGDLVIVPRPSITGERRAEISGRAKSDSLLRDQEAVCLQVVARGRNAQERAGLVAQSSGALATMKRRRNGNSVRPSGLR